MSAPGHEIDDLVRAHLERRAGEIDPGPLSARIWETANPPVPSAAPSRHPLLRGLAWAAAAAALLVAFFGGTWIRPAGASPETVVREAREAHHLPLDRCYLVEVRRDPGLPEEVFPAPMPWRVTRLWTRGDRFWIESTNPRARWAWGRDERGGIWMAAGGLRQGLRFDTDEAPRWLEAACDVFSMQPETLLGEVLHRFDLVREPAPEASSNIVIRARPRPGRPHPRLGGAVLEIDAETRVVRRLVLNRTRLSRPVATVTYTLVETEARDESLYRIEGHLPSPSEVYTRDRQPDLRRDLLVRWFGSRVAEWLKAPPGEIRGRNPGK